MNTTIEWIAQYSSLIIGAITVLSLLVTVVSRKEKHSANRYIALTKWLGTWMGVLAGLLTLGLSMVRIFNENLLRFIDTPREVIVVVGCLVVILCSIVCTIYFRPARMTVIAGVALGFIAAVLFVEGIFAAQAYMDKRLSSEKKAVIPIRAPSTT